MDTPLQRKLVEYAMGDTDTLPPKLEAAAAKDPKLARAIEKIRAHRLEGRKLGGGALFKLILEILGLLAKLGV